MPARLPKYKERCSHRRKTCLANRFQRTAAVVVEEEWDSFSNDGNAFQGDFFIADSMASTSSSGFHSLLVKIF